MIHSQWPMRDEPADEHPPPVELPDDADDDAGDDHESHDPYQPL
ncbi:hypothetical protein SAMN05421748_105255 [Paractinoplanes atraurantiacus]|uniref:Uncharacterized protein n=1 Tax=Paractinoplanes atraurantiacus TaxID=1036182 RepID=A0A285HVD3_9ACTN|nr:hypothetical protein SAMN05421748_105255 [Actinoplanes atraurantiacus]